MTTALLLIDLQKDFFRTEYEDQNLAQQVVQRITKHTNRLLETAREYHLPVFFAITSVQADGSDWNLRMKDLGSAICIEGSEGEAILEGLKTDPGDIIIKKTRYSAFFKTDLLSKLESNSIDSLIIGGINTHACIRTAAVDAFMSDYRVFIPEECVASYNQEYHETSMKYFSRRIAIVLSLDEMIQRIKNNQLDFRFSD